MEKVSSLSYILTQLWIYAILFIIVYIPAAIVVGYWHRKTQLKVEQNIKFAENPVLAKFLRIFLDMKLGAASKEEIQQLRNLLAQIERK